MQLDEYRVDILRMTYKEMVNYCYLIRDISSREALLVDASWNLAAIEEKLNRFKVKLSGILLTHSHLDHTYLADTLARKYNAKVYMSEKEIKNYNFTCTNLTPVVEGNRVRIGETTVLCIETPGHTSGSMCYFVCGCAFTGDTLFTEGCGICSGEGASPNDMYQSLMKLRRYLPRDTYIYPAHSFGYKPGYDMDYILNNNIYMQFKDEQMFVDFRMRKNQNNHFKFK